VRDADPDCAASFVEFSRKTAARFQAGCGPRDTEEPAAEPIVEGFEVGGDDLDIFVNLPSNLSTIARPEEALT
jgi:hypothetical protein